MKQSEYRAWNKELNIMCYGNEDDSSDYWDGVVTSKISLLNHILKYNDNYIFLEYIGVRDKNNVKIYDGDIVEAWSQGECRHLQVKWVQSGSPRWILFPAFKGGISWDLHASLEDDGEYRDMVEVIGNIYENPELMEI